MFDALRVWSLLRRAKPLMRAGKFAEAVVALDELVVLRPQDSGYWVQRAVCRRQLQDFAGALVDARQSLTIKEDDASVWEFVGRMLMKLDRAAEAVPAFNRALELEPTRTSTLLDRGGAFHLLHRNREALVDFEAFTHANPLSPDGYFLKAGVHEDLWEPAEGLAAVEHCLKLAPKAAAAMILKGRLLGMLQRPDDAIAAFDAGIAAGADPDDCIGPRTYQLIAAGRHTEALPPLERLIAQWPSRDWFLQRAKTYTALGEIQRAQADRREAVRLLEQSLNDVRRTGVRRNAVLIQANNTLFQPGENDNMSLVLLTFDDAWNADVERLQAFARQLFALKERPLSDDPVMRAAANAISNDYALVHRRQPLPTELTAGALIFAADLKIYRDFLPEGRLTQATRVLPVLAEPGDSGRIEMQPWPGSLAAGGG